MDSTFIYPLYRGKIAFNHGVLYIVALYALIAFFQCHFYSMSAHLAIHIVDLHLYWWPPIFYYCRDALLARRRFSV